MKNKILFAVSLLFGLFMVNAGLNKFFNYIPVPDNMPQQLKDLMTAFGSVVWLMPLIGAAEIVGGILFILPKTRALGALVICPVLVGIVLTHVYQDTGGLPVALIFVVIWAWVVYENRQKLLPLLS